MNRISFAYITSNQNTLKTLWSWQIISVAICIFLVFRCFHRWQATHVLLKTFSNRFYTWKTFWTIFVRCENINFQNNTNNDNNNRKEDKILSHHMQVFLFFDISISIFSFIFDVILVDSCYFRFDRLFSRQFSSKYVFVYKWFAFFSITFWFMLRCIETFQQITIQTSIAQALNLIFRNKWMNKLLQTYTFYSK